MVNFRLVRGVWKMTALPEPVITIFGGAKLTFESEHSQRAYNVATKFAQEGFSIVTGGGHGIMEAANLGAYQYIKQCENGKQCKVIAGNLGIGVSHLDRERHNPYVQDFIVMNHFFERKWLLVRNSVGFVVFPGGYGTFDELFEILTLMQCKRMPIMPVVLMGVEYWTPMMQFFKDRLVRDALISIEDLNLFTITDDVDEAVKTIMTGYAAYQNRKKIKDK